MEDLIIITLILISGAYFLTHRAKEETELTKPLTTSLSTQTEPLANEDEQDAEKVLDTLLKEIKQFNHSLK